MKAIVYTQYGTPDVRGNQCLKSLQALAEGPTIIVPEAKTVITNA